MTLTPEQEAEILWKMATGFYKPHKMGWEQACKLIPGHTKWEYPEVLQYVAKEMLLRPYIAAKGWDKEGE